MDDERFWSMIEDTWTAAPGAAQAARTRLATRAPDEDDGIDDLEILDEELDDVMDRLRASLEALPQDDLLAFDRILERKLHALDRSEIQAITDGSDDGFLYCRGFIVALGQRFYEAVDTNPAMAILDAELEEMCYLPFHIYEDRFGPVPPSDISRETGANEAGWPAESDA